MSLLEIMFFFLLENIIRKHEADKNFIADERL